MTSLQQFIDDNLIPNGLGINKTTTIGQDDELFNQEWNQILQDTSFSLMNCLVRHYERQIPRNESSIKESYDKLREQKEWTKNDEDQFNSEMNTIINKKEDELKKKSGKIRRGPSKKNINTIHKAWKEFLCRSAKETPARETQPEE